MQDKKQIMISVAYLVVIILLIAAFAYFNKTEAPGIVDNNIATTTATVSTSTATSTVIANDTPLDVFAKCVTDFGLTMYGAAWCSHCANEKKAFGESFKYIKYVECPDNIKLCTDRGINGYPTWMSVTGQKYEGELGLKGLARVTGCVLPAKVL